MKFLKGNKSLTFSHNSNNLLEFTIETIKNVNNEEDFTNRGINKC